MKRTNEMSQRKAAVSNRTFLLWVIATALVAVATLMTPGFAYADDQDGLLPAGTLTLDASALPQEDTSVATPVSTPSDQTVSNPAITGDTTVESEPIATTPSVATDTSKKDSTVASDNNSEASVENIEYDSSKADLSSTANGSSDGDISASNKSNHKSASNTVENSVGEGVSPELNNANEDDVNHSSGYTASKLETSSITTQDASECTLNVVMNGLPKDAASAVTVNNKTINTLIQDKAPSSDDIFTKSGDNFTSSFKASATRTLTFGTNSEGKFNQYTFYRYGYTFLGYVIDFDNGENRWWFFQKDDRLDNWFTFDDGEEDFGPYTAYAVWQPTQINITFMGDSGNIGYNDKTHIGMDVYWHSDIKFPFQPKSDNTDRDSTTDDSTVITASNVASVFHVPTGYLFKGWMSEPYVQSSDYSEGYKTAKDGDWSHLLTVTSLVANCYNFSGFSSVLNYDVTIWPVFDKIPTTSTDYKVTYYNTDSNGAAISSSRIEKTYNDNSTQHAETLASLGYNAPTENGYTFTFGGWAKGSASSTAAITTDGGLLSDMSNDQTLYAIWTKTAQTFEVIYYINDGSSTSVSDIGIKIADDLSAKSNNDFGWSNGTKTFGGWYVNAANSSTTINAGSKFSTLGSSIYGEGKTIKLYAKWNSTEYTVNFKDEDGTTALPSSVMSTTTADYNVGSTSVAVPSSNKQGYTFGGWKLTNASGVQVANASGTLASSFSPIADKTYTFAAIWSEITYTINWYEEWINTNQPVPGHTATTKIRYKTDEAVKLDSQATTLNIVPADKRETSGSGSTVATYEFQGWYVTKGGAAWDSSSAGTPIDNLTLSGALAVSGRNATSNSLTIYAVWKKIGGAVVQYSDNKGTYGAGTSANLHTDNKLAGDSYTIWNPSTKPTLTGYTFVKWTTNADGTGTSYTGGETITLTNPRNYNFYAQWTPNTVHFKLENGAVDSSINLHGLTDPTALVGEDVTESTLTGTAQPTRDNYDFKGWSLTANGPVVVLDSTSTKYTVTRANGASAAPAINELTLYATWEPTKYTVKYFGNPVASDTKNSVKFTQGGNPISNPYTYTTTAVASDSGFDNPGIDYIYGDGTYSNYSWYKLVGWSTTPGGTTAITNNQTFATLYGTQTDKVLELYAIWEAKTIDVYYKPADSNGTVSTDKQLKINLATGQDSDVQKSHAAATATGYDLATPTWTDTSGNSIDGCSTTNAQADYAPSIDYLRKLKTENHDSFTFRANFTKGTYNYEVWAYLEDANGNFPTSPKKYVMDNSSQYFQGVYGDSVTYTTTVAGMALKDIVLNESTGTVLNSKLYDVDTSSAHSSSLSVNLVAEHAGSITDNVIKIFYTRKTYNLTGAFQTEDKNGGKTTGAPTGFAGSAASYINNGNPTTGLRWGQSIPMTNPAPSKDGYVFSWSVTSPSGATSAAPATTAGSSFALNETDFANLGSNDATLTGTFKVKTYTITLKDEPDPGEPLSMHNWTSGDSASTLNSAHVASKTGVAADETLGTFVPDNTDTPDLNNYFVGWYRSDDSAKTPISRDSLLTMKYWDQLDADGDLVVTLIAIWKEKVVISYIPGDTDSYSTPKAAWTGGSVKLGNVDTTSILANVAAATFESVVPNSVENGNPKANPGWEFDYWTIQGGTNEGYGHKELYAGTTVAAATKYLQGTTATGGIRLNKSYTFVAHWKAKDQTVVIKDSGKVYNNTSNTDTVTATLPTVTKTYVTDSLLDLSDYKPTSVPAGYTFTGWKDVNGTTTYGKTDTFYIKDGGVVLEPTFNEDTAEINFTVASASSSRGVSIAPAGSETVYVVKHNTTTGNTIATRTASTNNTHAYKFSKWTYGTATAASDPSGQITADDVFAAIGTLVGGSTYTFEANFDINQYTVTIDPNGTDGTQTFTGVARANGTGSNGQNGYKVDWNTTIPSGAVIQINVPTGYELDGWIVDGTGTPQTWGTPTAANYQGIMSYQVTDDHKLTPHFKVSDKKNFIVNYVFDPEGISHFAGSTTSNNVTWNGDVLPTAAADSNPTKAGYTFKYWYVDKDNTNKKINDIDSAGHEFGKIYNYLKGLKDGGATVSGVDTTPGGEAITIYAKWEAKKFTVAYDTYGRDDAGNSLADVPGTDDDPNPTSFTADTTVHWDSQASMFKKSATALTRPGYDLDGWYATYDVAGVAHESSSNVGDGDTFATLAENNEQHDVVTLHAIWKSHKYTVEYIYNDAAVNGSETPSTTGSYGWTELRDFFNDPAGNHPSASDWTFDGWDVTYSGNNGSGSVTGGLAGTPSRVTSTTGNTTLKALRNGDTLGLGSVVVLTLKGHWTQQTSFTYKDILVHVNGSEDRTSGDVTPSTNVEGNTDIYFSGTTNGYGTPKTKYEGYDFDNHIASNPNHWKATKDKETASAGSPLVYEVYYLERSYTIEYYLDSEPSSSAVPSTTDNPWESAVITVPGTNPTRDGYDFGGWEINGILAYDPTDSSATKKLSELYTTAPTRNTVIKAMARWNEKKVTITWRADTGGTLDTGNGSKTELKATDSTWISPTPKAIPDTNYVFDAWYARYTDGLGSHLERVNDLTTATPYATLSGADKDVLTMQKWNPTSTSGDMLWREIEFIAKFAPSKSIKVTIHHYKQDTNAAAGATNPWIPLPDTYEYMNEGDSFTATPLTTTDLPGFRFEASLSKPAQTGVVHAASTNEYKLYYLANSNNLHYEYVAADGMTAQATGEKPTDAPALSSFGDGNSYYTDQKVTVANAPISSSSAWTFAGWYLRDPDTNTVDRTAKMDGSQLTFAGKDIYLVGTWIHVTKHVEFIDCDSSDQAYIDNCRVIEPTGGFDVYYGGTVANKADRVSPTLSANATKLSELPVTVTVRGAHELIGWNVLIGGTPVMDGVKPKVIGKTDPLSYPITDNVTFRAVYADTYAVTYEHGLHSDFATVTWSNLPNTTEIDTAFVAPGATVPAGHIAYNGTTETRSGHENYGNPNGDDGWAFMGWGYTDTSGNWHYCFAYDSAVDYGTTVSPYTAESMPGKANTNYHFVAFWKAMPRKLVYSLKEYDGHGMGSYTESTTDFKDSTTGQKPAWGGTPTTETTLLTGQGTTLLADTDVKYDGYKLIGWTYDGVNTLDEGSATAFKMPEFAFNTTPGSDSVLYLYPVFEVEKIHITYVVDDDSKSPARGTLEGPAGTTGNGYSDDRNIDTDKINGSTPVDKPGYEFDYWTKGAYNTKLTAAEGLQSDGRTLVPIESGEYHAHFKQKEYNFEYAKSTTDTSETLPTAPLPVNAHWTDSVNTGVPTYNGYDFDGWDVYEKADWDANHAAGSATKLHSGLKDAKLVSELSNPAGTAVQLVLVPSWSKTQLGLTYHSGSAAGVTWSTKARDFPTKTGDATIDDPMNTGAYTAGQQEKKINAVIDDVIDLRQASSITRKGYKLVGWMDTATADAGTNYYYFDADLDGDGTPDAGVIPTSPYVLKMGAKSVDLYPIWAAKGGANGYQVTFDDGVTDPTDNSVTGLPTNWSGTFDGKNINVSAPSRAGYTFDGWTADPATAVAPTVAAGATASEDYAVMAGQDDTITTVNLIAKWKADTNYKVTYVVNAPAGTTYSGATVAVPDNRTNVAFNATDIKQTKLAEADLPGYTFKGWVVTRDDDGTTIATVTSGYGTDAVYNTLVGNDAKIKGITYTAQWEVKHGYKVTFDDGVADPTDNSVTGLPTEWTGDWDGKNINVSAPSRNGYTFTGWTADPTTATAPAATATTADYATMANGKDTITTIKLTANWKAKDYTVTYHLGAGSWSTNTANYPAGEPALAGSYGPADPTGAIEYATNSTVTMRTDDAVERDGYTLVGWQDDATTPTNVYYVDSAYAAANSLTYTPSFTMPAANVDLHPIWEKTIYTVTFEPGTTDTVTGMPTPNPWTGGYDDTVTYAAPTLTGYTFGGWDVYETADYNSHKANPTQATLLVHVGAGSDTYSALANDPSKDKLTMVAIWTAKGFGLTYVLTRGEGTWLTAHITDSGAATPQALISHNTNDTFNLRNASTVSRPGWTLVGWKDSNSGTVAANEYRFGAGTNPAGEYEFTMPAANVYLYPIWEENDDYAVKFDGNAPTANTSDLANLPADQPVAPAKLTWEGATGFVDTHAPSFVGYKFLGWTVKGTDRVVINGTDTTPLKGAGYYFNVLAGGIDSAAHKTLTLIANWEVDKTYAVTFVDGVKSGEKIPVDTGTMPDDQTGLAYTESVDHAKPTRRGYTFVNWTVEDITDPLHTNTIGSAADGTSAYKAIAGNPAYKALRLTANWTPLTGYSVTFDDGVTDTSVTDLPSNWSGEYIATDIDVSAPSRKGYTFSGWTTDTDGATAPTVAAGNDTAKAAYDDLATQDDTIKLVKLIANWTPITYQVTFDAGTTDAVTGLPSNWSGNFDAKNIDVSAPSRLGHIFVGWTTTTSGAVAPSVAAGATAAEAYATMAGDDADIKVIDLVATWTVMKGYNVHFVDKPVSDTGTTPVNMGTLVDILNMDWDAWFNAGPKPTRPGYTWLRWDVTYTTDPYNVVHIGTATEGSYQYCSTAINMTTGRPDDTIYDLDFTAIWQPEEHTVTYVLTSGEGSWVKANITDPGKNVPAAAVKYDVDDTVTVRQGDTVVRAGYTLVGWQDAVTAPTNVYLVDATYAAAQGATVTATFTMPANDVLLYPIWNAKAYAVYFEVNKPVGATDVLQVVSGMPADQTDLAWTDDVDTKHPTLAGYTFTGWTIKDAATTGAKRGTLTGTTYKYNDMALTDTPAHASLTLVAQWEAAPYRVIYVDSTDATGAAVTPATQIDNNANAQWDDILGIGDPASMFGYAGKSASDWQFDGWDVYDPNTNTYVRVLATDDTSYSALAARENLTVADVATATDTPALVLYAAWTRRVPFIVDYVLSDTSTVEGSDTLTGLDGDDIATTWATKVLDMGDAHKIAGYTYNHLSSTPGITGTLTAGADTLHLVLYYDPLTDYVVTYDATPGTNYAGSTTDTAKAPAWNSVDSGFAPNDADWAYKGHKIDHWTYGPTGTEYVFDATDGKTFAQIAAAIYGAAADGTQGRDLDGDGSIDKPVTLHAVWVERDDYIVKYDDNYSPTYDNGVEDKFLARTDDATFTPADRVNVVWSSDEIDPKDDTSKIVEPGVKDGEALYEIEGWNYSTDGGLTQHPADGMSFEQIANVLEAAGVWSDGEEITLYARWKEIQIQLTYTPVVVTVDGTGAFNAVTANGAGGTVTRTAETVSAVTGGTASGTTLVALGSTPIAAAGYHFIGWRRVSDGTTIYVTAPLSGMSTMSLTAMAATGAGFNVLPNGTIDATTIFAASQNTSDGYWHSEDYQAMFVENDPAILHYNKNADDAYGTIADVTKPYGTLLTLDSGTEDATADTTDGFHRTGYTLRGWNTKADLTGTHYDLSTTDWPLPKGETTLYAEWTINDGRLIYNKNAGDAYGTIADVVKPYGTAITLDSGTEDTTADTTDGFHRPHYVLVGWNTKADYTGTHYDLSEAWTMPDGTTVLYAEWQKAKYEVSGPEGTKTTLPEGGEGTKTDGGYITGGDVTKIEYGNPVPEGWIDAIPEAGKHVDHWTYTWTDEDGTVHTETADDPTEFTVKGNGTITAVFVDDPVEEPETPAAEPASTTPAAAHAAAHAAAGETMPQTSDTFDAALPMAVAGLGLLLILLAFVTRRRDDEDEQA